MGFKIDKKELDSIITKACEVGNITRSKKGLDNLADIINNQLNAPGWFGDTFFYRLNNKIENNSGEVHAIHKSNLDMLIRFITNDELKNYDQFKSSNSSKPNTDILESLLGFWYSYVRSNSGLPVIYKSPVQIFESINSFKLRLRGGTGQLFEGNINITSQNLISHLKREDDLKEVNLIFRIGNSISPKLLQGVYSGISTNGDPICGREILVKASTVGRRNKLGIGENDFFKQLENKEIKIGKFIRTEKMEENEEQLGLLFEYFEDYSKSVIKVKSLGKFSWDELKIME